MPRVLLPLLALAAWLSVAAPAPVVTAPRRAALSADLELHQALRPEQKTRVIVHGTPQAVRALAARQRVRLVRVLEHEAVLEATGPEIERLASEAGVDHLSGDVPVRSAMSVSTEGYQIIWGDAFAGADER